jgi:hypothetical protein
MALSETPGRSRPDSGDPIPVCQPNDVRVTLEWESDGAKLRGHVVVENVSARTCRLPGKPAIVPVGQDGNPLPVMTLITLELMGPGYVDISPGQRAAASAGWGSWCGQPAARRALIQWDGGEEAPAEVRGPAQPGCDPEGSHNLTSSWFRLISDEHD